MIWTPKRVDEKIWHPFFALLPRTLIDGRRAWMHTIERRIKFVGVYYKTPYYEYRATPGS